MSERGIDFVTVVHKLVGVAWLVAVILMAFTLTPDTWYVARNIAVGCALATIALGIVYGIWTEYGFARNVWVNAKWILAVIIGAGAVYSYREPNLPGAFWVFILQFLLFAASIGIGISLERDRHARSNMAS
jgi:hypothetical protein